MNKRIRIPTPYTRLVSGLVAFVVITIVVWVGMPLLGPLYILLCILALQEYTVMMNLRGIPIRKRSLWVATVLTLPASLPVTYENFLGFINMQTLAPGVSWREGLFGMLALYLFMLEVVRPNENSMQAVVYTLFGYFYIPWLLGYAITLRYTPDGILGLWYLVMPALAIISSDIGAYIFGRLFGKHKLSPLLSPKKTLEGAIGGLVSAVVIVSLMNVVLEGVIGVSMSLYNPVIFSLLVASAAQMGDLFESLIKRWAGVKDAGFFLPGHGGVLDRLDSVIIALPVTYYFVTLFVLR